MVYTVNDPIYIGVLDIYNQYSPQSIIIFCKNLSVPIATITVEIPALSLKIRLPPIPTDPKTVSCSVGFVVPIPTYDTVLIPTLVFSQIVSPVRP